MSLWFICYYTNHVPLLNTDKHIIFTSLQKFIFIILNGRYGSASVCRYADMNLQRPEVLYPFGSCELSNVRELSPLWE